MVIIQDCGDKKDRESRSSQCDNNAHLGMHFSLCVVDAVDGKEDLDYLQHLVYSMYAHAEVCYCQLFK